MIEDVLHLHGRRLALPCFVVLGLACFGQSAAENPSEQARPSHVAAATAVEAGRYLVVVGGCNDCHTDGYADTGGNVPEADWLTGSVVGWRGPWGTTYPSNLRLLVQMTGEDAWLEMLRHRNARPPMPWVSVNALSEQDARALYRYIYSLGPRGNIAPAAVAPDVEPSTPYILMVPQHLDRLPGGNEESAKE